MELRSLAVSLSLSPASFLFSSVVVLVFFFFPVSFLFSSFAVRIIFFSSASFLLFSVVALIIFFFSIFFLFFSFVVRIIFPPVYFLLFPAAVRIIFCFLFSSPSQFKLYFSPHSPFHFARSGLDYLFLFSLISILLRSGSNYHLLFTK